MLQLDISAHVRNTFGKSAAKNMRREGVTPAILYGRKKDPVALGVDTKEITKQLIALQRRNAVINLNIDDNGTTSKKHVILKEVQTNPVTDDLVHTDFCEISLDEAMTITVPLNFTGKAKGVELGGDLIVSMKSLTVKGPILNMPDTFDVDITELEIGDNIQCDSIAMPDGVELLGKADATCVSVMASKREAVSEEEETEE